MRVLVVGRGAPERGGIPSFLAAMTDGDLARRHQIRLLNLARTGRAGGRLSLGNAMRTVTDAAAVWRASRDVDIVHIHSALAPAVTLLRAGVLAYAARFRRRRVVVHAHGGRVQLFLTTPLRRAVARFALLAADTVVVVSEGGREALIASLGDRRVVLIENGVDVERFRPAPPGTSGEPVVLYAGGLTPRKGVVDLFTASQLLADRSIDHRLVVVGGTPDEGAAAEREVMAAAPDSVEFRGAVPTQEMALLYSSADVFCLPSWWEAAPLTVLEAMASGLPVVATAVGDVPRLVEHRATGLVVPAGRPDLLADALAEMLVDVDGRQAMGRSGRARVCERWNITRTLAEIDCLYRTGEPA